MTRLEAAILQAIDDRVAQHDANTEVQIRALSSAVDDLMTHQAQLQLDVVRYRGWLERIADGSVDHDSAMAMARAALRGMKEPPP